MNRLVKRVLVVNPNTSQGVTDTLVKTMTARAGDAVYISGVTGRYGARIVSTEAENIIASYGALDLVAQHGAAYDAVILGISFDSGLRALQDLLPVPVIGITQAALSAARQKDQDIAVIFFGEVSRGLYVQVIESYGVTPIAYHAIDMRSVETYLKPTSVDDDVVHAINDVLDAGAKAVVLCGAAIVGMAARLQPRVELPLFDGIEALDQCLLALAQGNKRAGTEPAAMASSINLNSGLTRLLAGKLYE